MWNKNLEWELGIEILKGYLEWNGIITRNYFSKPIHTVCIFRVGSSTQVANVIVDNNKDDEDDNAFLVEEAPPLTQEVINVSILSSPRKFRNHVKIIRIAPSCFLHI